MKFFSVALVSVLFGAAVVSAALDAEDMRKSMQCGDGVFAKFAGEHKEVGKYYTEYKTLANETNLKLSECVKIEDTVAKEECVESAIRWFAKVKLTELINKLKMENEGLASKLMDSIEDDCQ